MKNFYKVVLILGVLSLFIVPHFYTDNDKKVTVESLFKNLSEDDSIEAVLNIDFRGRFKMDKTTTLPVKYKETAKLGYDKGEGAYIDGNRIIDMFGYTQSSPIKEYCDYSNDAVTNYIYSSDNKSWQKSIIESDCVEPDLKFNYNGFKINKDIDVINDIEVYRVSGKLKGSDLKYLPDELSVLDLDDVIVDANFYFMKNTNDLYRVSLDFSKTDFTSLLSDMSKNSGIDSTISFDVCKIDIDIKSINSYSFEVPEE